MKLISNLSLSKVAGGIDSVRIGNPRDGFVDVSTVGINEKCARTLAPWMNWGFEHVNDSEPNPYSSYVYSTCSPGEISTFLRNLRKAMNVA